MTSLIICKIQRCTLLPNNFPQTNSKLRFMTNTDTDNAYYNTTNHNDNVQINIDTNNNNDMNPTFQQQFNISNNNSNNNPITPDSCIRQLAAPVNITPIPKHSLSLSHSLSNYNIGIDNPLSTSTDRFDTISTGSSNNNSYYPNTHNYNNNMNINNNKNVTYTTSSMITSSLFGYSDDYGGNGCSLGDGPNTVELDFPPTTPTSTTSNLLPTSSSVQTNQVTFDDSKNDQHVSLCCDDLDLNKTFNSPSTPTTTSKISTNSYTSTPQTTHLSKTSQSLYYNSNVTSNSNSNSNYALSPTPPSITNNNNSNSNSKTMVASDAVRIAQWFEFYLGLSTMTALFSPPAGSYNNTTYNNTTINNTCHDAMQSQCDNDNDSVSLPSSTPLQDGAATPQCKGSSTVMNNNDDDDDFFSSFASDF